jgi:hypothetical protein
MGTIAHSGSCLRTPSLTVAGAVQGLQQSDTPRTCFPFHPLAGIGLRTPCNMCRIETRRDELYPAGLPLPNRSRKIMKDLHKRPLLLDAAENLPL